MQTRFAEPQASPEGDRPVALAADHGFAQRTAGAAPPPGLADLSAAVADIRMGAEYCVASCDLGVFVD